MKTLISFLAASFVGFTASAQNNELLFQRYILVKDALVNSDSKTASAQAAALLKNLESYGTATETQSMITSVKTIATNPDLKAQRKAFAEVSEKMWNLLKSKGGIQRTVYYQYCPMKKAYWLSQDSVIRNPYYGAQMLTCGSISDKKQP
ncbi:MAG: DUF3347 domain-containing protein [Chitinophagales bacterium]|nr:DUF3347 domain-containing protein [Chitinophagales bacterium]